MPRVGGGLELKHSRDASGCVQWHERSGKMLGNAGMSGCSWWATRTTSTGQGTNFPASVTIVCWSLEPDERLRESSGLDSPGPPELPEESGWGTPAEGVPYFLPCPSEFPPENELPINHLRSDTHLCFWTTWPKTLNHSAPKRNSTQQTGKHLCPRHTNKDVHGSTSYRRNPG